jgi:hypothetical protein
MAAATAIGEDKAEWGGKGWCSPLRRQQGRDGIKKKEAPVVRNGRMLLCNMLDSLLRHSLTVYSSIPFGHILHSNIY